MMATCVVTAPPAAPPIASTNVQPSNALDRNLIRAWREWASIVADYSVGPRPALHDADYRALHQRLLAGCNAQVASTSARHAALLRKISDLAQPWLNLHTLSAADRETLASLHRQCQAISEKVGGQPASYRWMVGIFLLLLAATSVYFFAPQVSLPSASSWIGFVRTHPIAALSVIIPFTLLSSMAVLKKLLRAQR
jgi:hypothetical protein